MPYFYINVYKGKVVSRVESVDKLIKANMDYNGKLPHAPYACMISNDIQSCSENVHINYEENEDNNSKYGFNGIDNQY